MNTAASDLIAEIIIKQRRDQGLPVTIADLAVLIRIARMLTSDGAK